MNLNEYQYEANITAIYPAERGLEYAILGLASEAGEVAGKLKKIIRDQDGKVTGANVNALVDELGDVLWYAAAVAKELNVDLTTVAMRNLSKLADRQARGVISGSGDNR